MNIKIIYDIAKSLLLARWRQTLIAAVGVMFSITMFIALLGFMNGLNDMLDGLVLNRTPHIRLFNEVKPNPEQPISKVREFADGHNFIRSIKSSGNGADIHNSQAIIQTLSKDPRVLGVAPKLSAPVLYNSGTLDITGSVSGIDAEAEIALFFFSDYVVEGNPMDLKYVANSIVLGKGVADKLLARIGDIVQVTTSNGDRLALKVVAYFQSGMMEVDKVQSYASISTVQKLLSESNNHITDIQIKLHNMESAPSVAREYEALFETDAEDIQTANAQFDAGTTIRTLISYVVGITLLVVAGFGIYNILNMMIYDKMDAIAILKATGFSGSDVQKIFIGIALAIGIVGGISGLGFGLVVSLAIDQVPFETSALPTISTYPVNYDWIYYVIGFVFALVTTYLAGYFPARKAAQIDPVDIIRGK